MKRLLIRHSKLLVLLFVITLISLLLLSVYRTLKQEGFVYNTEDVVVDMSCSRTTKLQNDFQYDRALSLIEQRLKENYDCCRYNDRAYFDYFPPELVNCIQIIEETLANSDFEGYFEFYGEGIRDDYFPIVVNSKYTESDDILLATLLVHEITHVQQYIKEVNEEETLSCIDREVDAFMSQRLFYVSCLNKEEYDSVYYRLTDAVQKYRDGVEDTFRSDFEGQLLILNTIQELHSSPELNCEDISWNPNDPDFSYEKINENTDCVDKEVVRLLRALLKTDEGYIKQCNL